MSLPWSAELCDVVREASNEASVIGAPLSSAFLLRALLCVPSGAQSYLSTQGVSLRLLDAAIPRIAAEEPSVVERIYDRSRRVAASARQDVVTPLHMLTVLADEQRAEAHELLRGLGVDLRAVKTMALTLPTWQATTPATAAINGRSRRRTREITIDTTAEQRRERRQIGFHPALSEVTSLSQWKDGDEESGAFPVLGGESPSQSDLPIVEKAQPHALVDDLDDEEFSQAQGRLTFPDHSEELATMELATMEMAVPNTFDEPTPTPLPPVKKATMRGLPAIGRRNPADADRKTGNGTQPPAGKKSRRHKTAREVQEDTAKSLAARLFGPDAKKPEAKPEPEKDAGLDKGRQGQLNIISSANSNRRSPITRSPITRTRPRTNGFDRFELSPKHFPTLAKFGRNLLAEAQQNRLDPVIARESEIEQLIDVLNKRRSNNPVLVGPAGVGKTAIVEGLARLMAADTPPAGLGERALVALDVGTLLCGTQLRGSFQERLIGIRNEVRKAKGRIIIFLDELHTWLGAGAGDAGSDAAGELKMALARGELPCIGATTGDEFKRFVEADPAFERRFETIDIKPPSVESAVTIIEGIIDRYSDHHSIEYTKETIETAVLFSDRYVRERTLPDKAIGILDRAGSLARRANESTVDKRHVAEIVASMTDMNAERLLMGDRERFLAMEEHLNVNLIGHKHIVERIALTIRRNYAGFASNRPIGSFLFLGPTGVGKTETVKVLADFLFGSRDAIVRFDMSEFMEQHAVARLLGAPPGYVGFEDGGQLTEAVRRRPHQIVLLDEIEKAHPDVMNILLQLLDEGRVTDGKGRTVDFSHTMVVMTSNLGVDAMKSSNRAGIGFSQSENFERRRDRTESAVLEAASEAFRPELWNRIEERLVFQKLESEEIAHIARLQLADSARGLTRHRNITLHFDDNLVAHLIDNGGYDPEYGARPMRKTIQRLVEAPVADAILRGLLLEGDHARVFIDDDKVRVEPVFDQRYGSSAALN